MITKEFLAELDKVRQSFDWKLVPDTDWSPERRLKPRLRILGTYRKGPENLVFEPIGAVCYMRTGRAFNPDAWLEAATAIQLSLIDAGTLTAAANDRTWSVVRGSREPDPYMQRLRQQLIGLFSPVLTESAILTGPAE